MDPIEKLDRILNYIDREHIDFGECMENNFIARNCNLTVVLFDFNFCKLSQYC